MICRYSNIPDPITHFFSIFLPYDLGNATKLLQHRASSSRTKHSYDESGGRPSFVVTLISFQVMRYENVNVKENDSLDPATLSPSNPREKWLRKRTHVKLRVRILYHPRADTDLCLSLQQFQWNAVLSPEVWLLHNCKLVKNWKALSIARGKEWVCVCISYWLREYRSEN